MPIPELGVRFPLKSYLRDSKLQSPLNSHLDYSHLPPVTTWQLPVFQVTATYASGGSANNLQRKSHREEPSVPSIFKMQQVVLHRCLEIKA